MTTSTHWKAWAFMGLSAIAAAAQAATIVVPSDSQMTLSDPSGSGRSASVSFLGGTGELAFSNTGFQPYDLSTLGGLISALNVGNVSVSPVGGATSTEMSITDPDTGGQVRFSSKVVSNVTSFLADHVTGDIQLVSASGGAQLAGTFISGVLTGGHATVSNLRFDLVNKTVIADLYGVKDAVGTKAAATYDLPGTTLWTFDTISGPTAIKPEYLLAADPVAALTTAGFTVVPGSPPTPGSMYSNLRFLADNEIRGLRITTAGFNFFKNSLGLGMPGVNALAAVNNDVPVLGADGEPTGEVLQGGYGTVHSTLIFEVPLLGPMPPINQGTIPEPSTYALMGLGLVGVALAVRRRQSLS